MCAGVLHESRIEKEVPSPLQGTPETEGRMGGGGSSQDYIPELAVGQGAVEREKLRRHLSSATGTGLLVPHTSS